MPPLNDTLPFHYLALLLVGLFSGVKSVDCLALAPLVGQVKLAV
jgi:hypothetical protein